MDSVDSNAQHLLGLIVKAAQLDAHQQAERHDLLRQASALLWWLEPRSPPRTIANLLYCLSLPLEQWLDSRFRQGYEGTLQFAVPRHCTGNQSSHWMGACAADCEKRPQGN